MDKKFFTKRGRGRVDKIFKYEYVMNAIPRLEMTKSTTGHIIGIV